MRIVLVTGASSGIGKAAALRLAESGFHVLAGVRKASDAKIWQSIPHSEPVMLDVTSDESVGAAIEALLPRLRQATEVHLVNNAGIAVAGPVEAVKLARWKEQFEVNVFGLVRITQALLPFVRATQGRIVNVSSVSGLATTPYLGPYSASKFAVEAISDALRRELRQCGCKVVVIEPGPTATPIWEKNFRGKEKLLDDVSPSLQSVYGRELDSFEKEVKNTARNAIPVDRVADVIVKAMHLARPRTRYVVGASALPFQMVMISLLPDRFLDTLLARSRGLSR